MTKKYTAIIKQIEGLDDLYIDMPGNLFTEMGWDTNTKLMWVVEDNGNVVIRPPKQDLEPGTPVQIIDLLKGTNENDSSN